MFFKGKCCPTEMWITWPEPEAKGLMSSHPTAGPEFSSTSGPSTTPPQGTAYCPTGHAVHAGRQEGGRKRKKPQVPVLNYSEFQLLPLQERRLPGAGAHTPRRRRAWSSLCPRKPSEPNFWLQLRYFKSSIQHGGSQVPDSQFAVLFWRLFSCRLEIHKSCSSAFATSCPPGQCTITSTPISIDMPPFRMQDHIFPFLKGPWDWHPIRGRRNPLVCDTLLENHDADHYSKKTGYWTCLKLASLGTTQQCARSCTPQRQRSLSHNLQVQSQQEAQGGGEPQTTWTSPACLEVHCLKKSLTRWETPKPGLQQSHKLPGSATLTPWDKEDLSCDGNILASVPWLYRKQFLKLHARSRVFPPSFLRPLLSGDGRREANAGFIHPLSIDCGMRHQLHECGRCKRASQPNQQPFSLITPQGDASSFPLFKIKTGEEINVPTI